MSVTFPVREAMKDLLLANLVVPSEPDGDLTVYNSPDDDDPTLGPITLNSFPTIIVQKGLYAEVDTWRRHTQAEVMYQWWLEIIVFLAEEKLPDWKAQKLVEDWQTAVANVILAQPTLTELLNTSYKATAVNSCTAVMAITTGTRKIQLMQRHIGALVLECKLRWIIRLLKL